MNGSPQIIGMFEVESEGDTLIVAPTGNLGEIDFQRIEASAKDVFDAMARSAAKNVVLDLGRMDYGGTTALSFFLRLWKRVQAAQGKMALCNVSAHELEILGITNLDDLWPIFSSRAEALRAVAA